MYFIKSKSALFFFLLFLINFTPDLWSQASDQKLKVLIPLYIYPSSEWDRAIADAENSNVEVTVIINVNDGTVSSSTDIDEYRIQLIKLKNAGIKALAYVPTCYGCQTASKIKTYINNNWAAFGNHIYGLDGFFFDQGKSLAEGVGNCKTREVTHPCYRADASPSPDKESLYSFYQNLYKFTKQLFTDDGRTGIVVLNTGVKLKDPRYLSSNKAADIIISGESYHRNLVDIAGCQENTGNGNQYGTMLHHSGPLSNSEIAQTVNLLARKNYRHIYFTNESWSSNLSIYFDEMLTQIEQYNNNPESFPNCKSLVDYATTKTIGFIIAEEQNGRGYLYKWNTETNRWEWFPSEKGCKKVTVDENDVQWVIANRENEFDFIWKWNGTNWLFLHGEKAKEISSGGGKVFCIGSNDYPYQWIDSQGNWQYFGNSSTIEMLEVNDDGNPWVKVIENDGRGDYWKWNGGGWTNIKFPPGY